MTKTSKAPADREVLMAPDGRDVLVALRDWVLKRGILFALISAPLISLFPGFFWHWISFGASTAYTVVLAFALLPVWVAYRKSRSTDPEEPVHHLHKYALWALVPYVIYNLARIPTHYLFGLVFWDGWYDYGSQLTGVPVYQWGSLLPGTLLHTLQGYSLALGFFILYKRHTLLNALCYVWLLLSTFYMWAFPTYALVDFHPPTKWFLNVLWAHLWMALAAWYVPRALYSPELWGRLRSHAVRTTTLVVIILIYVSPLAFVFVRVAAWEFPLQRSIDNTMFNTVRLVQQGTPQPVDGSASDGMPTDAGVGGSVVNYEFTLRFGPRPFQDYIKANKALDAGPITIRGVLLRDGEVVAFCFTHVAELETPNTIKDPKVYPAALQRMTFTDIRVSCTGSEGASSGSSSGALTADWVATVTLVGDRHTEERQYRSTPGG